MIRFLRFKHVYLIFIFGGLFFRSGDFSIALLKNYVNLGVKKISLGEIKKIEDEYELLQVLERTLLFTLEIRQTNRWAINSLGKIYFLNGNPRKAQQIISKLVQEMPLSRKLIFYRWMFRQNGNKYYTYEEIHKEALNLGLEFPESHVELGRSYWEMRNFDQAIFHLKRGLELAEELGHLFPRDEIQAHYWLGKIYYRQDEFEIALKHFQETTELDPENRERWFAYPAHLLSGDIYVEKEMCDEAAESYLLAYKTRVNENQADQVWQRCDEVSLINGNCHNEIVSVCKVIGAQK